MKETEIRFYRVRHSREVVAVAERARRVVMACIVDRTGGLTTRTFDAYALGAQDYEPIPASHVPADERAAFTRTLEGDDHDVKEETGGGRIAARH